MQPTDATIPGRYDFKLSDAQEARARRLHNDSIIIDLLSQGAGGNIFSHYPADLQSDFQSQIAGWTSEIDCLTEAMYWPYEMSRLGKSDLLRQWLQDSGITCGTYGIDVHNGQDPELNKYEALVLRYGELPWLRYVTTAGEIRQAKRDGVVSYYGHCQPMTPAPRNLAAFDRAYANGLRSFMLTYNQMDNIGVGCMERVDAGLSKFGVDVVKYCNDVGIIVDVSHCGHLTTLDACRHSKKPVNANHTAARALSDHVRGKSDDELRAIAETGGVIGVVALPIFLSRESTPSIEHMLDHIDYIANCVGWEHVAIGTDWPMQIPDQVMLQTFAPAMKSIGFHNPSELDPIKRLLGFDDCRDLPNITRGLVSRGYTDPQIRGILGENALRVFEQVCG